MHQQQVWRRRSTGTCACLSGFGRPHVEDNLHDGHCIQSCRYLYLEYAEYLFVLVLVGRQTAVDSLKNNNIVMNNNNNRCARSTGRSNIFLHFTCMHEFKYFHHALK